MFEELSKYKHIFVTGPQRSGTTIAARMIAEDTGKRFVPEAAMAVSNKDFEARIALPRLIDALAESAVIQCPIQCRYVHELSVRTYNESLVVMMIRDVDEIIESEKRIGWDPIRQEALYSDILPNLVGKVHISKVKYVLWNMVQKPHITNVGGNALELHYDSLWHHPLWIPKEQRINFGPRQISPSEDYSKLKLEVLI